MKKSTTKSTVVTKKPSSNPIDALFAAKAAKPSVSEYDWDDGSEGGGASIGSSASSSLKAGTPKEPPAKRAKLANGGGKDSFWASKGSDSKAKGTSAPSASPATTSSSSGAAAAPATAAKKAKSPAFAAPSAAAAAPSSTTAFSSSSSASSSSSSSSSSSLGQAQQPASESTPIEHFGLSPSTLAKLRLRGVLSLFPIQTQTYAPIRAGRDLIGRARTGQGKTLAFCLPLVELLIASGRTFGQAQARPLVLVMSPTRELAKQIISEFGTVTPDLVRLECLYGGTSLQDSSRALRAGVDVVVGTPGRIKDLVDKGWLVLSEVRVCVYILIYVYVYVYVDMCIPLDPSANMNIPLVTAYLHVPQLTLSTTLSTHTPYILLLTYLHTPLILTYLHTPRCGTSCWTRRTRCSIWASRTK